MAFQNLTDIIRSNAERMPDHPAQRFWNGASWVDRSYGELWNAIQSIARGLRALGIGPGDHVGLMSSTRPEWVICDYAILCLDAVSVPIYPSTPADQIGHIVEDAKISWAIVENDALGEKFPLGTSLVVVDAAEPGRSLKELGQSGDLVLPKNGRGDLATLVYTSGTTGLPKGAMLTHGNLLGNIESVFRLMEENEEMSIVPEDVALSLLPLSHILERTGHNIFLFHGVTLAYARSTASLPEDLSTLKPTLMIAVPRVFEKIYARVMAQAHQFGAFKRHLFFWAVHAAQLRYQLLSRHQSVPAGLERLIRLYDRLVFQKVRQAVGGRLRYVIAGGAPLTAEIGRFFFGVGIPVLEGYGLTETAPVLSVNVLPVPRYGTVGRILPDVEITIAPDGEILARGPNVARGYWNLPEDTAEAFRDGWFHTGDVGEIDGEGYLKITDRKKNIIVLSTGKNVATQAVEQLLLMSPLIEQAVVLGNRRKYISALLALNSQQVRQWAQKNHKAALAEAVLLQDADLMAHAMAEVERTTASLAAFERPKRIAFLPEELSEGHGELTPSLKVKLPVIEQRYSALIENLYASDGDAGGRTSKNLSGIALSRILIAIGAGIVLAVIVRLTTG